MTLAAGFRASRRLALRRPAPRFCASFAAVDKAKSLIQDHGCVVFSKTSCPFCAAAKEALNKAKAKHHVMELDKELKYEEMSKLQDFFLETTGARSVPRVFIGGKCIGGGSETMGLYE
eukprot:CAMPEP_0197653904 /NCGR_PEP_ID=MMETSP1338-20131121/37647_1 /TAXON_ID=43686 ORGANISM="Pelagodinium beii, Strain RCC1491" /NCGR_SAMPLE_ID=MMETSP1338 /ASSEMBLY_ACC=CAM_ASM_000754 /LENGTH=117 /DNA_ID=CAMNT_0043229195 /DNA_START=54 /DNA_END=404 /DNA_ORIENTATION=+